MSIRSMLDSLSRENAQLAEELRDLHRSLLPSTDSNNPAGGISEYVTVSEVGSSPLVGSNVPTGRPNLETSANSGRSHVVTDWRLPVHSTPSNVRTQQTASRNTVPHANAPCVNVNNNASEQPVVNRIQVHNNPKFQKFSGKETSSSLTYSTWIKDINTYVTAENLSNHQGIALIKEHVTERAREEVAFFLEMNESANYFDLVAYLNTCYLGKQSETEALKNFYARSQGQRESIEDFVSELQKLIRRVVMLNPSMRSQVDKMLINQVVDGLKDEYLQTSTKMWLELNSNISFIGFKNLLLKNTSDVGLQKKTLASSKEMSTSFSNNGGARPKYEQKQESNEMTEIKETLNKLADSLQKLTTQQQRRKPKKNKYSIDGTYNAQFHCNYCNYKGHLQENCIKFQLIQETAIQGNRLPPQ